MSPPTSPSGLVSLEGRRALVTGGSGGIGAAIVRIFLEAGAGVASGDLPGRVPPEGSIPLATNVGEPALVRKLVADAAERLDGLDLVVHCAGITRDAVLWKMEEAAWDEVLAVNLDSAFHLLKAAAPWLRRSRHGSVILISSINGQRGKFGQANYAASKAGLLALAKTAAIELGASGVRVNAIAPGLIDTALTERLPPEIRQKAVEETLLKRAGSPDDVARAALFLASDMSRHVTGQVLRVDGGQITA